MKKTLLQLYHVFAENNIIYIKQQYIHSSRVTDKKQNEINFISLINVYLYIHYIHYTLLPRKNESTFLYSKENVYVHLYFTLMMKNKINLFSFDNYSN